MCNKNDNKILNFLYRFIAKSINGRAHLLSDKTYLELLYRANFGKKINLDSPITFSEKLQWLKLNDRNPIYTELVDKYLVRGFVSKKIGDEYLIPILGVWDNTLDIDIRKLPDKFVIKCNHDSGSVRICKNKNSFDFEEVMNFFDKKLKQNYYFKGREWPYKNVKPKIIVEELLESEMNEEISDYKFMCFNGKVECCFTCTERFSHDGLKVTFFDRDWNVLPFERHYPKSKIKIKAPVNLIQMILLAEELSEGIPFVRVDFYEVNKKIYFGELTFYPGGGFQKFNPEIYDEILGNKLNIK